MAKLAGAPSPFAVVVKATAADSTPLPRDGSGHREGERTRLFATPASDETGREWSDGPFDA